MEEPVGAPSPDMDDPCDIPEVSAVFEYRIAP